MQKVMIDKISPSVSEGELIKLKLENHCVNISLLQFQNLASHFMKMLFDGFKMYPT